MTFLLFWYLLIPPPHSELTPEEIEISKMKTAEELSKCLDILI